MRWAPASKDRRKELETNFQSNLTNIAESAATHEGAESVSVTHLNSAYQTLSRLGLSRRRFFERAESQTALGAFFIGAALSCPTAVQALIPEEYSQSISIGLLLALFIVGTFFLVVGLYTGKFPPVPTEKLGWRGIIWRIAIVLFFLMSVFVAGNSAIQHFLPGGNSCGGPSETKASSEAGGVSVLKKEASPAAPATDPSPPNAPPKSN